MERFTTITNLSSIACVVLLVLFWYQTSLPDDPSQSLGEALGSVLWPLMIMAVVMMVWIIGGWIVLGAISKKLKKLPPERSSNMFEVARHLQPAVYLFGLANLAGLWLCFGGFIQ